LLLRFRHRPAKNSRFAGRLLVAGITPLPALQRRYGAVRIVTSQEKHSVDNISPPARMSYLLRKSLREFDEIRQIKSLEASRVCESI
jgi:hypothetical protein